MRRHKNTEVFENLEPLEGAAVQQYEPVFNDQYWLGPSSTALYLGYPNFVRASKQGAKELDVFAAYNDGMQRLGDPAETIDDRDVIAKEFQPSTVVKVLTERLSRPLSFHNVADDPAYTCEHRQSGYSIYKRSGSSELAYTQEAQWFAVGESKRKSLAFYELIIAPEESYGTGLHERYQVALKVQGADINFGVEVIEVGSSRLIHEKKEEMYERARSVTVYRPIYVPEYYATITPFDDYRH